MKNQILHATIIIMIKYLITLMVAFTLFTGLTAHADDVFANEKNLLFMAINNGQIDLTENEEALKETLIRQQCRDYAIARRDDFTFEDWLDKKRQEVLADAQKISKDDTFIQVNTIQLGQYDQATQSFPLTDETRLQAVGFLPFTYPIEVGCDPVKNWDYYLALPHQILIRLELPLNLYRLPVSEVLGQRLVDHFNQLTRDIESEVERTVYTRTYFKINDFFERSKSPEYRESRPHYNLSYIGLIDKIEFFVRDYSNQPVQTLYYDML